MQTDQLVADLITVSGPLPCDRAGLTSGLAKIRSLRSVLDAFELAHVSALEVVSPVLEGDIGAASRVGTGEANKIVKRAHTGTKLPELTAALAAGEITAAHIDAVAEVLRREEPAVQRELLTRSAELAEVASKLTVGQFRKAAADMARQLSRDGGMTRLERQRRDTTCRTWTDHVTGMWHLNAAFDPELAVRIARQLNAALERRYAGEPPPSTPSDPIAKQDHLRAHALADLILGRIGEDDDCDDIVDGDTDGASGTAPGGASDTASAPTATKRTPRPTRPLPGPPEVLVIWDTTQPIDQVDWGLDVDIPPPLFTDLLAQAGTRIHHYLTRNGVIVDGPGELVLERTTRLANRAQRRALHAMYRTCATSGCTVSFDKCKIHHIIWWEHGGSTNLDNLLPICPHHHARIHSDLWQLQLTPDRTLTIHNQHGHQLFPPAGPNRTRPQAGPPPPPPGRKASPSTAADAPDQEPHTEAGRESGEDQTPPWPDTG